MEEKDISRFWSKVNKTDGCWLWTGNCGAGGYGHFWLGTKKDGKDRLAHRVSYELTNGPIPKGIEIMHLCDTPACIRPDHLVKGTHTDNMRDMFSKGRRHSRCGENHHNAKLTQEQVNEIRKRYAVGETTFQKLADEYGVDQALVHRIVRGLAWKESMGAGQ